MSYDLFEVTQGAIVKNDDGKVLILEGGGKWLLPGGHVARGENWIDALHRELQEEIGLEHFKVEGVVDIAVSVHEGHDHGLYIVTFLIAPVDFAQPVLSGEHTKFEWVALSDLDRYTFWHESIKERIKKGIRGERQISNPQ